jgi:hypothetical protein
MDETQVDPDETEQPSYDIGIITRIRRKHAQYLSGVSRVQ